MKGNSNLNEKRIQLKFQFPYLAIMFLVLIKIYFEIHKEKLLRLNI